MPELVPLGTVHIVTPHFNVGILDIPQKPRMPLGMVHIKQQDVVKLYVGGSDAPLNTSARMQPGPVHPPDVRTSSGGQPFGGFALRDVRRMVRFTGLMLIIAVCLYVYSKPFTRPTSH